MIIRAAKHAFQFQLVDEPLEGRCRGLNLLLKIRVVLFFLKKLKRFQIINMTLYLLERIEPLLFPRNLYLDLPRGVRIIPETWRKSFCAKLLYRFLPLSNVKDSLRAPWRALSTISGLLAWT